MWPKAPVASETVAVAKHGITARLRHFEDILRARKVLGKQR